MESEKEVLTDLWNAKNTAVCRTSKLAGTSGRHTCTYVCILYRSIDPEWIFRKTRPAEVIAQKQREEILYLTQPLIGSQWQCRVRR